MLHFYHCAITLHYRWLILACAAFYRVACCQFLRVYRVACYFAVVLCLHVSKLVYNRLFRVSMQLQNVRLYNYHDGVKMHSRRVCFRLVAFTRFAWCQVLPRMLSGSFAACGVGSLQAGNVMWCGACRVVLSACAACGMLSACGVSCHPVKACGVC